MLRTGLVIAVAIILGGSVAHAQAQRGAQLWYQAYQAGVRDVGRGAWDSAVQNLLAAKQSGPQPARRVVFYGDLVDVFNPDYYLGVAYLNLRRFADADAAFERVRQANLIPANDKLYAALQTQASTARGEVALAQAEDYLAKGNETMAAEAAGRAATFGISRARVQDLQQRVAALRKLADAAGAPQGPIAPAQPPSPAPVPLPNPLVAQQPLVPTISPPGPDIGLSPQPAPRTTGKSPVSPAPPPLKSPTALLAALKAQGSLVPAASERDGIAAFFSGRYDEAALTLAAVASGPQGSARARFYLACSLAAQVLAGDREQSQMSEARAQLRDAGRLDQFVADRRFISPRVLTALAIQSGATP